MTSLPAVVEGLGRSWRRGLPLSMVLLLCAVLSGATDPAAAADQAAADQSVDGEPSVSTSSIPESADALLLPGLPILGLDVLITGAVQADDPGFIVGDWELQSVPWSKLWLNGGHLLPRRADGPVDARGIPMRPHGDGPPAYNPTVLAQQGMKRLDSWKRTGKRYHRHEARRLARKLDEIARDVRRRRWQPHPYQRGSHRKGWVNGNSHGLVLAFFSRFYLLTGNQGMLDRAARLMPAFERRPDNKRWFTMVTKRGYLWFEHWPDGAHVHTLNAHLNVLFGLYDYWVATGSPVARQLILGGAATVRAKLKRFRRRGQLSRYSLSSDLATKHYHHTHIRQLRVLARITGDDWFRKQAARFKKDERKWRKGREARRAARFASDVGTVGATTFARATMHAVAAPHASGATQAAVPTQAAAHPGPGGKAR